MGYVRRSNNGAVAKTHVQGIQLKASESMLAVNKNHGNVLTLGRYHMRGICDRIILCCYHVIRIKDGYIG